MSGESISRTLNWTSRKENHFKYRDYPFIRPTYGHGGWNVMEGNMKISQGRRKSVWSISRTPWCTQSWCRNSKYERSPIFLYDWRHGSASWFPVIKEEGWKVKWLIPIFIRVVDKSDPQMTLVQVKNSKYRTSHVCPWDRRCELWGSFRIMLE